MDTSKLYNGMIVKNYKELCELLGEKVKAGNSKKYQMKEMERFFEYKKDGNKFELIKIYNDNEIKEKDERRKRKALYGDIVQVLLMDILSRKKGRMISSKTKMTKYVGLVNDNYSIGYKNQKKMSNFLDIEVDYVKDFYEINNNNISNIIEVALKSLEHKALIDVNEVTMVHYYKDNIPTIANDKERRLILEAEERCLKALSLNSKNFKVRNSDYYNFHSMLENILKNEHNIKYTYKAYDIVINNRFIDEAKIKMSEHIMSELERTDKLKELNNLYAENVINNAKKRHENYTSSERMLLIRFSEVYVSNFEKMTNTLVKLDALNVNINLLKEDVNIISIDDEMLPF